MQSVTQTATINVRLPLDLKQKGDRVLQRENSSISDVVRGVYGYIEREQKLPDFLEPSFEYERQALIEQKRKTLNGMVGVLPPNLDGEQMKSERLARQTQSGVRL